MPAPYMRETDGARSSGVQEVYLSVVVVAVADFGDLCGLALLLCQVGVCPLDGER